MEHDAAIGYTVAVRALCEFGARAGDLDLRFTPAPSAAEGQAGHALVAARRGAGYETEVALAGTHGPLRVRGRADGWDPARGRLEEVKTHRGRLERQPRNQRELHWAQARVYGWLMCASRGLPEVELALVYYELDTGQETVLTCSETAAQLREHFERLCISYLDWAEREATHRLSRDRALAGLSFPYADFRPGQRSLAEAAYKATRAGRCLVAQAPTGIGKTMGTLFPLLKAMPERLDRVFFLTAKTSGRAVALDAAAFLARAPFPLRVLELVARDKACEHPDKACHGESCPLARGFHDRLGAARLDALTLPDWRRESVRVLAARHGICPYYLAQELARWSDVVVGDYNHYFDTSALLHALATENGWRVALLVDEAHNLVERARGMYSAAFDPARLRRLRREGPPALRRSFDRVLRRWKTLAEAHPLDYQVLDDRPDALVEALQRASSEVLAHLVEHGADSRETAQAALLEFCFEALAFVRLAELHGEHSLLDLARAAGAPVGDAVLTLRNVVPAPFLRPRLAAARGATLFSATLQPPGYHAELLGLPADWAWIDVDAPFRSEQLAVRIAGHISTRWQHRDASLEALVETIARQFRDRPGNYLAFFSSYDYLDRTAALLAARHPGMPLWSQARGMSEAVQAAFLERFVAGGRGVGFAVLGGAFAEGVDLPGERLVGAFVATLGLPQVNPVNEQIRRRIDRLCGRGFDYTYLYPGLQKVVQAAGRVIRTPDDRGVVHLLDDRFLRPEIQSLLPRWWVIPERAAARAALPAAQG